MEPPKNLEKYGIHFDATLLFQKLSRVAKKAGIKAVWCVLVLYYSLQSSNVSSKDRKLIIGALGYFILPIDLLPDFVPFLGYADDYAALAYVVYKVAKAVTPEVKAQADVKLHEWFGDYDAEETRIDRVDWGADEF